MLELIRPFFPILLAIGVSIPTLGLSHYLLLARHKNLGSEAKLPRQFLLLILTVAAVITWVMLAPVPESTRNQVLGLFGIAISGVIALASTSFVANFMAAIMLRVTRPFEVGDFITVGELFGKVSERGLFDTEVQTENRELVAIPNSTFITQPVTVARSSGTIISSNLSLGYDVHHEIIQNLLIEAASNAGLSDPYVHITTLGDFSINYRICGLLTDVEGILTARSRLNREVLNSLHKAGIEIASPTITRHITHPESTRFIPATPIQAKKVPTEEVQAEDVVFDKEKEQAVIDAARQEIETRLEELKTQHKKLKSKGDNSLSLEIETLENQLTQLTK